MEQTASNRTNRGNTLNNALKGAVAGAIGVWVMDRLDWFIFTHEDPAARRRTEQVRPNGLDPAHVAVNNAAEAMGTELSPAQPHPAGVAMHYALGIGPAALYGAFRERLPMRSAGQDHLYGLGLGLGLYLIQDQALNSITGLSADPRQYPWQAHARGLAAHLVLGLVTNTVLNLLKAPRPHASRPVRSQQNPVRADGFSDGSVPRASLEELEETFLMRPEDAAKENKPLPPAG
jgi:hypothetical protein